MGLYKMSSLIAPDEFNLKPPLMGKLMKGDEKIIYALTGIRGIGRRFASLICKKGEKDTSKRAGEFTTEDLEKLKEIISSPKEYNIPLWFLNNQKKYKSGEYIQEVSNSKKTDEDNLISETLKRLKTIQSNRGKRHQHKSWKVRGQHTRTTGRGKYNAGIENKKKKNESLMYYFFN